MADVRVVCITEGAARGAPDGERSRDPGFVAQPAGECAHLLPQPLSFDHILPFFSEENGPILLVI